MQAKRWLKIVLYLIAVHSSLVGVGLLFIPPGEMHRFGYGVVDGKFFLAQGGVFHLVMVVAYLWAAIETSEAMVKFAIIAKYMATAFLVSYFLFFERVWIVLLSGIADFIMGSLIVLIYIRCRYNFH